MTDAEIVLNHWDELMVIRRKMLREKGHASINEVLNEYTGKTAYERIVDDAFSVPIEKAENIKFINKDKES